jgi:hypothetical protein
MGIAKGKGSIFVYDTDSSLVNIFSSAKKVTKFFECTYSTITKYIKNGKLF